MEEHKVHIVRNKIRKWCHFLLYLYGKAQSKIIIISFLLVGFNIYSAICKAGYLDKQCTPAFKAHFKQLQSLSSGSMAYMVEDKSFFQGKPTFKKFNFTFFVPPRQDSVFKDSFFFIAESGNIKKLYDGNYFYSIDTLKRELLTKIQTWPEVYPQINSFNVFPITCIGRFRNEYLSKGSLTGNSIQYKDTTIHFQKCWLLKLHINHPNKDTINFGNLNINYAISQNGNKPVFYSFYVEGFGGKTFYLGFDIAETNFNKLKKSGFENYFRQEIQKYDTYKKIQTSISPLTLNKNHIDSGTLSPAWKLKVYHGDSLSLMNVSQSIIILDFWYIRCYPCQLAIPMLNKLYSKYKDKGLTVLGLNPYDSRDTSLLNKEIARLKIQYPILLTTKEIPDLYNVSAYPTLFVLDKNKKIIFKDVGYTPQLEYKLEQVISNALK